MTIQYEPEGRVLMTSIRERKWLVIMCALIAAILSCLYVLSLSPVYQATAKAVLSSADISQRENLGRGLNGNNLPDVADVKSQVEVMTSYDLIELLVVQEDLYRDPALNGVSGITDFYALPKETKQAIIRATSERLSVRHIDGTYIVAVTFTSQDPAQAAQVANALIDIYAETETAHMKEKTKQALDWLTKRLQVLRQDVINAQAAVINAENNNFSTFEPAPPLNEETLEKIRQRQEQLEELRQSLAQTDLILEEIDIIQNDNLRMLTVPAFLKEDVYNNLRTLEDSLARQRAEYTESLDSDSPEMRALEAEYKIFQNDLAQAVAEHRDMLHNKRAIELTEIRQLENEIENLQNPNAQSEDDADINMLEAEAEIAKALLENFTKTYLSSLQNIDLYRVPAHVISVAMPVEKNRDSEKLMIVLFSAFAGLVVGVALALVSSRSLSVIYSESQLERQTKLPVYASLPKVRLAKGETPADFITQNPSSPLTESVRTLYTSLQLRDPHRSSNARVVTFSSTYSGEGKTTSAIWLATIAAQNGKKVLVIDADMRQPSLHKGYNIGNARGLADYLSERLPLDDTIYKNHPSGVHVMTSKAIPTHALVLLTHERMENMMRRLKDMYDLIIIDAPTAHIFSDARVLAKLSDKIFYIVEWGKAHKDDMRSSLKYFLDIKCDNIAFILNKISKKSFSSARRKQT